MIPIAEWTGWYGYSLWVSVVTTPTMTMTQMVHISNPSLVLCRPVLFLHARKYDLHRTLKALRE